MGKINKRRLAVQCRLTVQCRPAVKCRLATKINVAGEILKYLLKIWTKSQNKNDYKTSFRFRLLYGIWENVQLKLKAQPPILVKKNSVNIYLLWTLRNFPEHFHVTRTCSNSYFTPLLSGQLFQTKLQNKNASSLPHPSWSFFL